ncbi:ROK family transcriptional regulator [Cellulomonas triticagri]|uniref:ROK family transcriptional regulator n=1 Tax=Cellulomonas triticagri TaxID=2483352 RepID=A0A3M2JCD4_9CELL|nr:ROK family transcriptional regulator [Cellulomonas triticagri]RMI09510.1 ROK family transcriptional regulator [Cellulomonas triticagri]
MAQVAGHAAEVLDLFRTLGPLSRIEVIEHTGLSRSTVNQRLAALEGAGLIREIGGAESSGGRPSSRFAFAADRARVLTADIGAMGFTLAVCDLAGTPLAHLTRDVEVWAGPEQVLGMVQEGFDELADPADVWAVAVGVPGPVEFAAHRVVNPPIMTGWDGYDIAAAFQTRYPGPVVVENDVNARAVAEARVTGTDNLIALKLGTGIGAGLVFNGRIVRGDKGAAGDIGHTRAAHPDAEPRPCHCGNLDCLETYAAGWALVRTLAESGRDVHRTADVVALVAQGDMEAVRLVRAAGRAVGESVATLVSVLNPRVIALSGQLAQCGEVLLSGVRERMYQQTLPLATRELQVVVSDLGELVGVTGLALTAIDTLLAQDSLDAVLAVPA